MKNDRADSPALRLVEILENRGMLLASCSSRAMSWQALQFGLEMEFDGIRDSYRGMSPLVLNCASRRARS